MDDHEDLPERERARMERRDRDLSAKERALMRTGLAKTFKQIIDRQAREAVEPPKRRGGTGPR